MEEKITWKVEGSPTTHEIPEKATVHVSGTNGTLAVWIDSEGEVQFRKIN